MAIEYVVTYYACGCEQHRGSTFGNPPDIAKRNAEEAGYLIEEFTTDSCLDCREASE